MTDKNNYITVREVIPLDVDKNSILNIVTKNVNTYTHGFHKYPAKFIPHIPKWAISKYLNGSNNKIVFDPFCGSGTTLVESMLSGYNCIGVDIDPLSALISKVKTTRVDKNYLTKISHWLKSEIHSNKDGLFIPDCKTIEHWFTDDAIKKLSIIRSAIDQIPAKFGKSNKIKDIQDLLIICFSSITRRVSNADNESQKTYVSHTKIKKPEEVNSLFIEQLNRFNERVIDFTSSINDSSKSEIIISSSATSLKNNLNGSKIDLAITSPPYIKAIDYIYNQMVELFWVGDLFQMQTQTQQNSRKNQYIGNKQIRKAEYDDYSPLNNKIGIAQLDKKLLQVYNTDKKNGHKHSYITYKYFKEMETHFIEMAKCLNSGVHYIMVVGNSSVSDVSFETSDYLVDIAEKYNFKIVNKWGYKIKNRYMRFNRNGRGGIIKIDWVLDFVKNT